MQQDENISSVQNQSNSGNTTTAPALPTKPEKNPSVKDYVKLSISVNVAIILASQLVAVPVVAILLATFVPLTSSSKSLENTLSMALWANIIASAVILLLATIWVFKMTYQNTKKTGRNVALMNSMAYVTVLYVIANGIYIYTKSPKQDIVMVIISLGIQAIVVAAGCFLGGKIAEKKLANPSPKTDDPKSNLRKGTKIIS
jgi:cytochrome bd-type quinol oxidase subunit 2